MQQIVLAEMLHRILGVFIHIFFSGQGFFINKAIQRTKPGILVLPHAAETASVAVGSCCRLLMHNLTVSYTGPNPQGKVFNKTRPSIGFLVSLSLTKLHRMD